MNKTINHIPFTRGKDGKVRIWGHNHVYFTSGWVNRTPSIHSSLNILILSLSLDSIRWPTRRRQPVKFFKKKMNDRERSFWKTPLLPSRTFLSFYLSLSSFVCLWAPPLFIINFFASLFLFLFYFSPFFPFPSRTHEFSFSSSFTPPRNF